MTIADTILYGLLAALDWVYGRVFDGHEGRLLAAMLLAFTIVGGLE